MAKILFGGPQEQERDNPPHVHDDLISRLGQEGHKVDYIVRGDEMLSCLMMNNPAHPIKRERYGLIFYDTDFFYDHTEPKQKVELFRSFTTSALKIAEAPVIVLAEENIAGLIADMVKEAGLKQINQPYDIEEVVKEAHKILSK